MNGCLHTCCVAAVVVSYAWACLQTRLTVCCCAGVISEYLHCCCNSLSCVCRGHLDAVRVGLWWAVRCAAQPVIHRVSSAS
jgi:hypothetical protein